MTRGIREITAEIWTIRKLASERIEALEQEIRDIRISRGQSPDVVYEYVARPTVEYELVRMGYKKINSK